MIPIAQQSKLFNDEIMMQIIELQRECWLNYFNIASVKSIFILNQIEFHSSYELQVYPHKNSCRHMIFKGDYLWLSLLDEYPNLDNVIACDAVCGSTCHNQNIKQFAFVNSRVSIVKPFQQCSLTVYIENSSRYAWRLANFICEDVNSIRPLSSDALKCVLQTMMSGEQTGDTLQAYLRLCTQNTDYDEMELQNQTCNRCFDSYIEQWRQNKVASVRTPQQKSFAYNAYKDICRDIDYTYVQLVDECDLRDIFHFRYAKIALTMDYDVFSIGTNLSLQYFVFINVQNYIVHPWNQIGQASFINCPNLIIYLEKDCGDCVNEFIQISQNEVKQLRYLNIFTLCYFISQFADNQGKSLQPIITTLQLFCLRQQVQLNNQIERLIQHCAVQKLNIQAICEIWESNQNIKELLEIVEIENSINPLEFCKLKSTITTQKGQQVLLIILKYIVKKQIQSKYISNKIEIVRKQINENLFNSGTINRKIERLTLLFVKLM